MRSKPRALLTVGVTWALLLAHAAPAAATTTGPGGVLIGVDGGVAGGHRVQLLDDTGQVRATTETDEQGRYRFEAVGAGRYTLAVVLPDGLPVPVVGGPRVDATDHSLPPVQLVAFDPAALGHAQRIGSWWGTLPTTGRVLVIVGVVAGVGIGVAALSGGGDTPASAF